jgi:hypothetical protein
MRYFFFLFLLFFPLSIKATLFISEIQVESKNSVNECYVKIYNSSQEILDISGYNLRKKTSTGNDVSLRVFPSGSFIKENDYFVWASSREENFPEKIKADVSSTQYLAKNNSVFLLDKNNYEIDYISWGEDGDVPNPTEEQIIKKDSSSIYLYPPSFEIPKEKTNITTPSEERKSLNVFFIAFSSSFLLALIVLYIHGRT